MCISGKKSWKESLSSKNQQFLPISIEQAITSHFFEPINAYKMMEFKIKIFIDACI
jgi:hypothetical protein